ncbi:hypothetical protein [uncultured Chitinophaga sp.]|uniref:hypothetical protein n=1 Tax=uncultured Chitinophaga sp. TaxID=339340 RepID=UPI00263522BA|nr:hypothetical protein [uncultured Chitinophaga sp.]
MSDKTIHIRHQPLEEEASVAALFENIFDIGFSPLFHIGFIPAVNKDDLAHLDDILPRDFDSINTEKEARLITLLQFEYVITNNPAGGSAEKVDYLFDGSERSVTLLYVDDTTFGKFNQELQELAPEFGDVRFGHPIGRYARYGVVSYLMKCLDSGMIKTHNN